MAATIPRADAPCWRASQHATPSDSNAAPATRATDDSTGESNDDLNSSQTIVEGDSNSPKPAPTSITVDTMSRGLIIGALSDCKFAQSERPDRGARSKEPT